MVQMAHSPSIKAVTIPKGLGKVATKDHHFLGARTKAAERPCSQAMFRRSAVLHPKPWLSRKA